MIPQRQQPWFEFSVTLPDGREKTEAIPADTIREALEKMRRVYPEARLAMTRQFEQPRGGEAPPPPLRQPRKRAAPKPEPTVTDFRAVFGLPRDAGPAEVQHAYREAIKRYHPDRVAGLGPELVALAEQKTREFNDALAAAKDHFRRKA